MADNPYHIDADYWEWFDNKTTPEQRMMAHIMNFCVSQEFSIAIVETEDGRMVRSDSEATKDAVEHLLKQTRP